LKNVKFKEMRQRGGYTQAALGQVLGITPDYVNIIENGRQTPGFVLAKRIADFFGVTVDELFFCESNERNVQNIAKDCTYGRCCYAAKFSNCKDSI